MPQTIDATYHDGVVELKHKPRGIQKSRALVVFLDAKDHKEHLAIDWEKVRKSKSSVDKWIGILEGTDLGDWKAERRTHTLSICAESKVSSLLLTFANIFYL